MRKWKLTIDIIIQIIIQQFKIYSQPKSLSSSYCYSQSVRGDSLIAIEKPWAANQIFGLLL